MHLSVPLGIPTARRYGTSHAAIEMNGGATLVLTSIEDADALITAACEAKRLLEPPCPSTAPETGRACTETGEHDRHRNGMVVWSDEPAPGEGGVLFPAACDPDEAPATPEERLLLAVHGVSPDNPANVRELRTHEAECAETDHTSCLAHLAEPEAGERCLEHSDPADDLYGQCVKYGLHEVHENVHHQPVVRAVPPGDGDPMSACWADPLSRAERRVLTGKLLRATRAFGAAGGLAKRTGEHRLAMALVLASGDTAVLYTDITERAQEATS